MKDDKYIIGANRNLPSGIKSKGDIEHAEHIETESAPPGKVKQARAKFQKHWKRFWCCYLIALIVLLAIFLPVLFLVIIPAIAQRIVEDTDLPVYSAKILDPKPDSVTFSLLTSLKLPAGISVHIDPLNLTVFNRDTKPTEPILIVPLDAYDLKGKTNISVTRNNTEILNEQEFIKTLTEAVYSKSFKMSVKGSTVGHLGALKASLNINKDVVLDGLDTFRGFSVDSARLLIPKAEDGSNLVGEATLPNHSVFTFELGNMTLNLQSEDLVLGYATINDVVLKPGNNTVALRGNLDIATVLQNIPQIVSSQRDALRSGELELIATGNSTIYNGNHIHYYEEILKDLELTARVPIMTLLLDTVQGMLGGDDLQDTLKDVKDALRSFKI